MSVFLILKIKISAMVNKWLLEIWTSKFLPNHQDSIPQVYDVEARSLFSQPTRSIAKSIWGKMSSAIALIIIAATGITYGQIRDFFTSITLAQLRQTVNERAQQEQSILLLVEEHHALLKKELLQRLKEHPDRNAQKELQQEFDRLLVKERDGTIRTRKVGFDLQQQAGVYISNRVKLTAEIVQRVLIFNDLASHHGSAWSQNFQNLYFTAPENIMVSYWSAFPWTENISNSTNIFNQEYVHFGEKKNNSQRQTVWTRPYDNELVKELMISCVTPVDFNGKHIANITTDLFLDDLLKRSLKKNLPKTYNIIFRSDGDLIIHPDFMNQLQKKKGKLNINQIHDPQIQRIFQLVKNHPTGEVVLDNKLDDQYLAVTKINGPDWYLVTVYPKSVLMQPVWEISRLVLLLGLLSLCLEIIILYWLLRQQISTPLNKLIKVAEIVALGKDQNKLTLPIHQHQDEIGCLISLFKAIATQVRDRQEQEKVATSLSGISPEVHDYLHLIIDNLVDGFMVADIDNKIKMFNPAITNLFKLDSKDLLGQDIEKVFGSQVANLVTQTRTNLGQLFKTEILLEGDRIGQVLATSMKINIVPEDHNTIKTNWIASVVMIQNSNGHL